MEEILKELKNNPFVKEKDLGGSIHSFNYSNKAFFEGVWNSTTIKARGLFCDMDTETVVARSFDKFFAIDERPETSMDVLKDTLKFTARRMDSWESALIVRTSATIYSWLLNLRTRASMQITSVLSLMILCLGICRLSLRICSVL